jgi:hypothetical protein
MMNDYDDDNDNDDECGAVDGMIDKESRSIKRKPAPVLFNPPQIPHDLTRVRNWVPRWEDSD